MEMESFATFIKEEYRTSEEEFLQTVLLSKNFHRENGISNSLKNIRIHHKHETPFSTTVLWNICGEKENAFSLRPKTPWLMGKKSVTWFLLFLEDKSKNCIREFVQSLTLWNGELNFKELDPDSDYAVHVLALDNVQPTNSMLGTIKNLDNSKYSIKGNLLAYGTHPFNTILRKNQMKSLLQKAVEFVQAANAKGMQAIQYLYRNKSPEYFCEIMQSNGTMVPYMKDFNGDPGNPINGCLPGLFFSGILDRNSNGLNPVSPFGTQRITLPLGRLLNEQFNLFFDDFYCYHLQNPVHYVTLVITHPGSEADSFCQRKLLQLDKHNNPFLCVEPIKSDNCSCVDDMQIKSPISIQNNLTGEAVSSHEDATLSNEVEVHLSNTQDETCVLTQHQIESDRTDMPQPKDVEKADSEPNGETLCNAQVSVTAKLCRGVHVEFFYTESIDVRGEILNHGAEFSTTPTIGRGYSLPEGVPKNSLCSICNIFDSNI